MEYVFECVYDAFAALHAAIRSGEDPKDFLRKTRFKGLSGDFYFDQSGDIQGLSFVLKQYRGLNAEPLR